MKIIYSLTQLALLLSACAPLADARPSTGLPTAFPVETIDDQPSEGQLTELEEWQTQTVDGVAVRMGDFRVVAGQLLAALCYQTQPLSHWIAWTADLSYGEKELGAEAASETIRPEASGDWRCHQLYFDAPNFELPASIRIGTIPVPTDEGGVCYPEYLAPFNRGLQRIEPELQVGCFVVEYRQGGGGYAGLRIVNKPAEMSQQEAEEILNSAHFALDAADVDGPWLFEVNELEGAHNQTRANNDITFTANHFRMADGDLLVDICHNLPDERSWQIWRASLHDQDYNNYEFGLRRYELRLPAINGLQQVYRLTNQFVYELDQNNGSGLRCDVVYFYLPDTFTLPATLAIESVAEVPGPGWYCGEEHLALINQALEVRDPGLRAECNDTGEAIERGTLASVRISEWPEGMDYYEAEALLHNDDFFLDLFGIRGPWVFDVRLDEPLVGER